MVVAAAALAIDMRSTVALILPFLTALGWFPMPTVLSPCYSDLPYRAVSAESKIGLWESVNKAIKLEHKD